MESITKTDHMLKHLHTKYVQQMRHSSSLKLNKIEAANFVL
jgi:hypothetical protein